jgi:mutual gliding-motility protein MglA
MSVDQMEKDLNRQLKVPTFAASAVNGDGVGETLQTILRLTLQYLQKQMKWAGS